MTKLLFTALLLTSWAATTNAQSEVEAPAPMVISTGSEGGGYWDLGSRLATAVKRHGGAVEVRSSGGSLENLQRLHAPVDPTSLALTQSDALAFYLQSHPAFAETFATVESIGRECVFVIAAVDSGLTRFEDFEQGNHRLGIPGEASGVAVTFKAMQTLRPALNSTSIVYLPPAQAMLELAKPAGQRQIDALMLVHRPKIRGEALKQAIYNPEQFRLLPLSTDQLDSKLPNGKPVYSDLKLPLVRENWSTHQSLDTICMEGLLLSAPQKLSRQQSAALKQSIDLDWMTIYAEPQPR